MKHVFFRMFVLFTLSVCFFYPVYAAETYTLDPMHSYVLWRINHFGFSNPSGKWMVDGTLVLDEKKPQDSKVNVTIKIEDMITGIPKLDEHLKSKDFFDVAQFPTATFVSNKVVVSDKKTAKVYGTLTVHGVSKPIILNVKLNKAAVSPTDNKKTVGFTASAEIKRSNFGIDKYLPGLGDDIKIDIEAEGKLK